MKHAHTQGERERETDREAERDSEGESKRDTRIPFRLRHSLSTGCTNKW